MNKKIKSIIIGLGIVGGSLFLPISSQEPLTVQEWRLLQEMYAHEIRQNGGSITIDNVKSQSEIIRKMNQRIRESSKKTDEDYIIARDKLMDKSENKKKNLLDKIIK